MTHYAPNARTAAVWAQVCKQTGRLSIAGALQLFVTLGLTEAQIVSTYHISRWALREACKQLNVRLPDGRRKTTTKGVPRT